MYPLLKTLLHDGLTQEVQASDGRARRYELTEKGRVFLETAVDESGELRAKISQGFAPFPFLHLLDPANDDDFAVSMRNLFMSMDSLRVIMQSDPSAEILSDLAKEIDRFATGLQKIREKRRSLFR